MASKNQYRLEVRFGDDLLEGGFTAVPNLFLTNYHDLGISDGAALWVVHILRFKWTEDNPYPRRSSIPMNANRDTQKRYARELRDLGFLFTRRVYWFAADKPPSQELVGRIRALEYDFTSLFHNLVGMSRWKAEKRPLRDFAVEIPPVIAQKVTDGHFHDVPQRWLLLCEQQVRLDGSSEGLPESRSASREPGSEGQAASGPLGCENRTIDPDPLGGENRTVDPDLLGGENHPVGLRCDYQPVENHPHNNKDSDPNKKQSPEEKEEEQHQQQDTAPPPAAVVAVVSSDNLRSLELRDDQVLLDLEGDGSQFAVMLIADAVEYEMRRRRVDSGYEASIYYSVPHALGEGPDDWTDEELDRIGREQAIEAELNARHRRLGGLTLEEALQQYFSPEFTAKVLKDRPASERTRIEDWVAYVRQQSNLTNPAGFLRTRIESGEAAPTGTGAAGWGSATAQRHRT